MDVEERNAAHAEAKVASRDALANPGALGLRKLAQLGEAKVEPRVDPAPMSAKALSDEEREISFLLSYDGNDKGLLWRKANAERERARQQAIAERQKEVRNATLDQVQTNANERIKEECSNLAHGVGQTIDRVVEVLEKRLAELDADVRIATKRAELAELHSEIAKAAPKQGSNELFYLDAEGNKQDAELHNAILGPVDHPIDEKIMGPIRARNRARWLAEREARRQRRG